jgi:hypothetical protein
MVVFNSCYSFKMFHLDEWQAFFKALGYAPPNRDIIATTLLDSIYAIVEAEVKLVRKQSSKLRLVANESMDILGN